VSLLKSKPGSVNYGTFGAGSITHLDSEAFAAAAGIKLTHIPYKGIAEVLPAVASGQIQIALSGIPPMLPLARQGRVKVLGAMTPQRVPVLPDVPTFSEQGYPGLVSSSWFALFAPAGTPRPIIDKIAADVGRVISQKEFDERFITGVGLEMLNQGPEQLAATVASDRAKYQVYVKNVGVKLD